MFVVIFFLSFIVRISSETKLFRRDMKYEIVLVIRCCSHSYLFIQFLLLFYVSLNMLKSFPKIQGGGF